MERSVPPPHLVESQIAYPDSEGCLTQKEWEISTVRHSSLAFGEFESVSWFDSGPKVRA